MKEIIMELESFLVKIVEKTDGWVIVAVFLLYIIWQMYKKHKEGAALDKALSILESTISDILKDISASVKELTAAVRIYKE
jgi:cell division protein FtsL